MYASPSLGSSLAQGFAEVLPAAAGADESMPDGSAELYGVQVEAETAVQPDETGGVAHDRLPDELVGANHVFGAPTCAEEGIQPPFPFLLRGVDPGLKSDYTCLGGATVLTKGLGLT